ncbi:MAG: glycosyltransferase [Candidatus Marsarchaeota archaeon]|jgi:cellulose synthase/poly-beta-1,6-N-acetylglucosamine synthase-like glycosyltransferase|nr:glycosyltransferase [Candidatus Marsarchaeota archaeon]
MFIGLYIILFSIFFGLVSLIYYISNARRSINYRIRGNNPEGDVRDVTIVVPVYNENPKLFERCIYSISRQGSPFIVVGDSSLEPYRSITRNHGGRFVYSKMRGGKRHALSLGMENVATKYVMFVDSDTTIPKHAVKSMLSKFGPGIGGVGTSISIRLNSNWISYASEFFEKLKEITFRAMAKSGAVMVLDGRCCMYQTNLISSFMKSDEYRNYSLLGIKSGLSDDRHITSHMLNLGYKAAIDYNVIVKTESQKNLKMFVKQMVRWTRAGYMYFLDEFLHMRYIKKGPFYTFEMLYMYALPVVTILLFASRIYLYMFHGINTEISRDLLLAYNIITLNFARIHPLIILYYTIQVLDFVAIAIFGIALSTRVKRKRKKTFAYGGIAMLIILFATFYGLLTIWKQNSWLTR